MVEKKVTVRQVRSSIRCTLKQKRILESLGLGRIGAQRSLPNHPSVSGMIAKVTHLICVKEDGVEK